MQGSLDDLWPLKENVIISHSYSSELNTWSIRPIGFPTKNLKRQNFGCSDRQNPWTWGWRASLLKASPEEKRHIREKHWMNLSRIWGKEEALFVEVSTLPKPPLMPGATRSCSRTCISQVVYSLWLNELKKVKTNLGLEEDKVSLKAEALPIDICSCRYFHFPFGLLSSLICHSEWSESIISPLIIATKTLDEHIENSH